jgi:hypothetical protein
MKHIKTPTRVGYDDERKVVVLYDADGEYVISRFGGDRCADQFREISAAVNAHDALVEACELVLDELDKGTTSGRGGFSPYENRRCQDVLRAELAKVRGEAE